MSSTDESSGSTIPGLQGSNWREGNIEFKIDGKDQHIVFVHNLPLKGMGSIESAIDNWFPRANNYTALDLIEYINSKRHMTGHSAMSMTTYNTHMMAMVELKKQGINPPSGESN
jgi:hypothetical protein